MKIRVTKTVDEFYRASFRFDFELEDDDKREANSFNAGRAHIFLGADYATFDFPFDVAMPHPDLLCMAALKIISPYVGSRVTMVDRPVSPGFAHAVYKKYPHIKQINVGDVPPRQSVHERWAVSFSGGGRQFGCCQYLPTWNAADTFCEKVS